MSSSTADLVEIALRLRTISRDDGSIDAAQVRVIGLDEIREAAGVNWPRMRERVRSGSMDILSKHTGPEDVIIPAGDGFLVILAEGAPGNNQERCKKMREALLSFYLGEDALSGLRAAVTPRSLTADGFADFIAAGMQTETADVHLLTRAPRDNIVSAGIFSARHQKLVAQWICPTRDEHGGRRLAYNPDYILDGAHHNRDYFNLDAATFEHATLSLAPEGRAVPIGFTVHATTLQNRRNRDAYFSLLTKAPSEQLRGAIITIAEIEKGTPLISIAEWCSSLRAVVGRVCLDFHYTDHAVASIGGAGAWAAGFHLPIYSGAQCGPRAARTLDQIRFWSKTIRCQGMRLSVNGFRDEQFLAQAAAAGVDLASGNVLWPFSLAGADEVTLPAALSA
jgi:hypothetical protein